MIIVFGRYDYSLYDHERSLLIHFIEHLNHRYVPTGFPPKLNMNSLKLFLLNGSPTSMKYI